MIRAPRAPRLLRAATVLVAIAFPAAARAQTDYPLGPESERHPGVPAGVVTKHSWTSRVYPGTERDYWVYVPAQYRAGTPAALMVFQDGGRFVADDGRWRIPIVFDNLIAKGEMPLTIGLFIDPGVLPARGPGQMARYNRSFEYDALGPRYARFLIEEMLPELAREYTISPDPNLRAIGGSSSGASCAFTVAWNRPDAFRRVLSFIGSYTGLRGGDAYATLVRKSEPRPIRVFLEDGSRDLDIYSGNWWLGNQLLDSALEYSGYDVTFVTGDRGHDSNHGSAVLPDALRWLWRDWTRPLVASTGRAGAERHFVTEILDPAAPAWTKVASAEGPIGGLATGPDGDVYFSDARAIRRVAHATGQASVFRAAPNAGPIRFGPDRRLYAAPVGASRIVAYQLAGGPEAVVLRGLQVSDFAVDAKGGLWLGEPRQRRISRADAPGARRVVLESADSSGALALSPDQALLTTPSMDGHWIWSHQLSAERGLADGQAFYRVEVSDDSTERTGSLAVDTEGFLYMASPVGVQVFDQPGRLNAILSSPPATAPPSWIAFGGPQLDTLYVAAGDTLFRRVLRRHGVWPWQLVQPPVPRL